MTTGPYDFPQYPKNAEQAYDRVGGNYLNAGRGRTDGALMVMITDPQRRFLLDLEKRGRDFLGVDKRVYSSLAKRGLVEGRFSALNDGYVCITPAGKEALALTNGQSGDAA